MGKLLEGYQNAVKRKEDSIKKKSDILVKIGEKLSEDLLVCPTPIYTDKYRDTISYIKIKHGYKILKIELEKNKCNIYLCCNSSTIPEDIIKLDLIGSCKCKSIKDIDNVLLMMGSVLYKEGLYSIIKNRH